MPARAAKIVFSIVWFSRRKTGDMGELNRHFQTYLAGKCVLSEGRANRERIEAQYQG